MSENDEKTGLAERIADAANETAIWREGQNAYRSAGLTASNPYTANSEQAGLWQSGFQNARETTEDRSLAWAR